MTDCDSVASSETKPLGDIMASKIAKPFYMVETDHRSGPVINEVDLHSKEATDWTTLIRDICGGQYGEILSVMYVDLGEGVVRDVSDDVANDVVAYQEDGAFIDKNAVKFVQEHGFMEDVK